MCGYYQNAGIIQGRALQEEIRYALNLVTFKKFIIINKNVWVTCRTQARITKQITLIAGQTFKHTDKHKIHWGTSINDVRYQGKQVRGSKISPQIGCYRVGQGRQVKNGPKTWDVINGRSLGYFLQGKNVTQFLKYGCLLMECLKPECLSARCFLGRLIFKLL